MVGWQSHLSLWPDIHQSNASTWVNMRLAMFAEGKPAKASKTIISIWHRHRHGQRQIQRKKQGQAGKSLQNINFCLGVWQRQRQACSPGLTSWQASKMRYLKTANFTQSPLCTAAHTSGGFWGFYDRKCVTSWSALSSICIAHCATHTAVSCCKDQHYKHQLHNGNLQSSVTKCHTSHENCHAKKCFRIFKKLSFRIIFAVSTVIAAVGSLLSVFWAILVCINAKR